MAPFFLGIWGKYDRKSDAGELSARVNEISDGLSTNPLERIKCE